MSASPENEALQLWKSAAPSSERFLEYVDIEPTDTDFANERQEAFCRRLIALARQHPQQDRAPQGEAYGWIVLDETGDPGFAAKWPQACHETINEAINEHNMPEAAQWTVRPFYLAPSASIDAAQPAQREVWEPAARTGIDSEGIFYYHALVRDLEPYTILFRLAATPSPITDKDSHGR